MRSRDAQTLDLFAPREPEPTEGALACSIELRHILNEAIKRCGRSRYQIVARMSELLATDVTKHQLDSWTAESRDGWRFPFEYAAAFEVATDSRVLTSMLAALRGCRLLVGEEAVFAELGLIEQQEQDLKKRKAALRALMRQRR